jgi:hypothetical protein
MLDQVANKIVEMLSQLNIVSGHARDLAIQAVQIGGFLNLAESFLFLFVFLLCGMSFMKYKKTQIKEIFIGDDDITTSFIIGCIIASVSLVLLIGSVINIFDFWNWVAIFNPKLYIAHQLIVKVGV